MRDGLPPSVVTEVFVPDNPQEIIRQSVEEVMPPQEDISIASQATMQLLWMAQRANSEANTTAMQEEKNFFGSTRTASPAQTVIPRNDQ